MKYEVWSQNEQREKANFVYYFVQKTNATEQLWWHFISTSQLNFVTQFSPLDPNEIELQEGAKSDFRQRSNF